MDSNFGDLAMRSLAIALVASLAASSAGAALLDATASGWINASGSTNNSGFDGRIFNQFIGFEGQAYYDFFTFALPAETITSATLNIWNAGQNSTIDPSALYSVHAPSDYSFDGLAAGPSFADITLGAADTGSGHYVSLTLDAAGVAYLNSLAGGSASLSGSFTSSVDPTSCYDCVAAFGFTGGSPVAQLIINGTAIPEPVTWTLMVVGFGLVGTVVRRRAGLIIAA